jgi:protein gp37
MSKIEWCDKTWNPVVGCSRVSAGCDHCYAMGVAHRAMQPAHEGLTKLRGKEAKRPGVDWNGAVRCLPERLGEPLRWRKPRRVFVNSMSDLFHEAAPFRFAAAVFGVMAACPQHTFIVLTKRPERAREFFAYIERLSAARDWHDGENWPPQLSVVQSAATEEMGDGMMWCHQDRWPLPNVILGVSVEDQATADERIPILLETPAAVRCVSYEPALGPVSWWPFLRGDVRDVCLDILAGAPVDTPGLDWVIVGGESGHGARPFHIDWARTTVQECRAAGVPCFVKQFGAWPIESIHGSKVRVTLQDRKGKDMDEWEDGLRVRQFPEVPR